MKHLPLFLALFAFMAPRYFLNLGFYRMSSEEVIVIIGLLFFLGTKRFRLSKPFLAVFGVIFLVGLWHFFSGNNNANFFKVFIGMFMAYLFSDYVIRRNRYDLGTIVNFYLNGAFFIAVIGVIQFVSYQVGFTYGYDYNWFIPTHRISFDAHNFRINAYFGEASEIGQVLAPAFFFSICSVFGFKPAFISKKKALAIIFVYFMSKSSLAMIGIVFAMGLGAIHFLSFKRLVQMAVLAPLVFFLIYSKVTNFRVKLETVHYVATSGLVNNHAIVGGSFFTLFENTLVAVENFKRHPWTGTGVGSHHIAYDKYALSKNDPLFGNYLSYNFHDASSLLNRMVSEMGLLGLIFILIFIAKNFVIKKDDEYNAYWIMSSAFLLTLLVSFVRKGHYFGGGLAFSVLMFYYIYTEYKRYQNNNKEDVIVIKPV